MTLGGKFKKIYRFSNTSFLLLNLSWFYRCLNAKKMAAKPPMMFIIPNTTGNATPAMKALNNTTTPIIAMSAPRMPCP
jgi:hypothetical protein